MIPAKAMEKKKKPTSSPTSTQAAATRRPVRLQSAKSSAMQKTPVGMSSQSDLPKRVSDLEEAAARNATALPPGDRVEVDRQQEEHDERAGERCPAEHQPPARRRPCRVGHADAAKPPPEVMQITDNRKGRLLLRRRGQLASMRRRDLATPAGNEPAPGRPGKLWGPIPVSTTVRAIGAPRSPDFHTVGTSQQSDDHRDGEHKSRVCSHALNSHGHSAIVNAAIAANIASAIRAPSVRSSGEAWPSGRWCIARLLAGSRQPTAAEPTSSRVQVRRTR